MCFVFYINKFFSIEPKYSTKIPIPNDLFSNTEYRYLRHQKSTESQLWLLGVCKPNEKQKPPPLSVVRSVSTKNM